jgi:hypothetical protein
VANKNFGLAKALLRPCVSGPFWGPEIHACSLPTQHKLDFQHSTFLLLYVEILCFRGSLVQFLAWWIDTSLLQKACFKKTILFMQVEHVSRIKKYNSQLFQWTRRTFNVCTWHSVNHVNRGMLNLIYTVTLYWIWYWCLSSFFVRLQKVWCLDCYC